MADARPPGHRGAVAGDRRAAVLSSFSAGIAIASRLFVLGPDGRPRTVTSEMGQLGWPLSLLYLGVFALTLLVGTRLVLAVLQVAIGTRRRRAHHRMVVDLVGVSRASGLRILDVAQPLAYCLPGVHSRVVVSEGTLSALTDAEVTAILTHERAHLRARHDLVLEAFIAVHAAFPRFVRSTNALNAVRLLIELLADDAAVRTAGPLPWPGRWSPAPRGTPRRMRWPPVAPPRCCGYDGCPVARTAWSSRWPHTWPRPRCWSCPRSCSRYRGSPSCSGCSPASGLLYKQLCHDKEKGVA